MKDKLLGIVNKIIRLKISMFLLKYVGGLDCTLLNQITPEEEERYYIPYTVHWRRTVKGRILDGLWWITFVLTVCLLWTKRYYWDGIVLTYGLARLEGLIITTVTKDYFEEKKKRNWGSK